jgi:hypothetical protein
MWFTGINFYKLAFEKDHDSIFTTITTIWKAGFSFIGLADRPSAEVASIMVTSCCHAEIHFLPFGH